MEKTITSKEDIIRIGEESALLSRWIYKFLDDEAYLEDIKESADEPATIVLTGFELDKFAGTITCFISWCDEVSETGEMSDTFIIRINDLEKFIQDNDE